MAIKRSAAGARSSRGKTRQVKGKRRASAKKSASAKQPARAKKGARTKRARAIKRAPARKRAAPGKRAAAKKPARAAGAPADPLKAAIAFARPLFDSVISVDLTPSGVKQFREVLKLTIADFIGRGSQHRKRFDESRALRAFLKREIRKIARKAADKAHGGNITGADLNRASVEVMRQTHGRCKAALDPEGRSVVAQQGEVCATFLAMQATDG